MSIYTEHFETVYGTRQNIQALRNKVLELAVKGKLVEQDTNDEPAKELLKRIQFEKEQLIKEKKIKKEKVLSEFGDDKVPFEIPESWEWVKLGNLSSQENGDRSSKYPKEHDYVSNGIPFFGAADMIGGRLTYSERLRFISDEKFDELRSGKLKNEDFVFLIRGAVGKMAIFNSNSHFQKGFINAQMLIVRTFDSRINPYLKYFFTSECFNEYVEKNKSGTAITQIPAAKLKEVLVPLPPISEQERIVLKVDSVMSEIDQLEKYLERKESLEEALPKAIVSAISNCKNEEELKGQLGLVIEHFSAVFQTPESLQELRNVILQLGIQGKLVPQDGTDEPANELLRRIQAEKELLIKAKKIKKEKALSEIEEDEIPFEIPSSWEWVRLGDITNYGNSPTVKPENIPNDMWVLDLEDIESKSGEILKINYNDTKSVKSNKSEFKKGDVLYGKLRPYLLKVLVAPADGVCTSEIIPFSGYGEISSAYIVAYLKSSYADKSINGMTYGMKMPRLGTSQAKNLLLPLPPTMEQQRIVNKIDSLFSVIDKLEKGMKRKQRIVKAMATV